MNKIRFMSSFIILLNLYCGCYGIKSVTQCGKLQLPPIKNVDRFGAFSTDYNTSVMVVGAAFSETGFAKSGAAFIYKIDSSGSWKYHSQLVQPSADKSMSGFFGFSTAMSYDGDKTVVCAPGYNSYRGRCYLFKLNNNGSGLYQLNQTFDANSPTVNSFFGWRVTMNDDGNRVFINAPLIHKLYQYDLVNSSYLYQMTHEISSPHNFPGFLNSLSTTSVGDYFVAGSFPSGVVDVFNTAGSNSTHCYRSSFK